MLKKVVASVLISITLFSCSSNTSSSDNTGVGSGGTDVSVAMSTRIDGVIYDTPPQNGGNAADATGGSYGNAYFLLKGYKNTGTNKVGNKIFQIGLAIPKADLSLGEHSFGSTLIAGGYYADFSVTGVQPSETVNTTGGTINVTSYNTTTKLMKGNFSFTTNNGVNPAATSHTLIGSFSYVLQ